jgi:biopolymer transport protein ExbB
MTGGIWKALLTTVAGLSVAIPTLMAHGFLSAAVSREEETLERGVDFIMSNRANFSRARREGKAL